MNLFTCEKLRLAVVVAGALLLMGFVLQVPRALVGADLPLSTTLLSGVGLAAVVLSPLLMLTTAVLALLPGVSGRLGLCNR